MTYMKIGFFLQNNKKGGLDTFVLQLLKNWPEPDTLILFCNISHPGLEFLHSNLPKIKIIPYKLLISQDLDIRFNKFPSYVKVFFKTLFWVCGYFYQVYILKSYFLKYKLDRLLVINGGHPGGDACLSAVIAWGKLYPRNLAWYNFHNFATPESKSSLRRLKGRMIDRYVSKYSKGFLTVSSSCLDSLNNRPSLNVKNKKFIYNGAHPVRLNNGFDLKAELSIDNEAKIVLMLGVYEPRKGHSFIIDVMEKVVSKNPLAHLLIFGDGNEQEINVVKCLKMQSKVAGNIHIYKHRDISDLLPQTDVLVVPSQEYESFGYTALEGMYSKIPVVVTNVGGLPEVVENNVCGYVIDKNDVQGFSDSVVRLLKNKELREFMGNNGYNRSKTYFTSERMSKDYLNIIKKK